MYSDSGICCSFFQFFSGQFLVTVSLRRIYKLRLFHEMLKMSQAINLEFRNVLVAFSACNNPFLSSPVAYVTGK